MVFNAWFADFTDAPWCAYRRHHIVVADCDGPVTAGWDGNAIPRWACTDAVAVGVDGMFGRGYLIVWHVVGLGAAAASEFVPVLASTMGFSARLVDRGDVACVAVARQGFLFEQSNYMR